MPDDNTRSHSVQSRGPCVCMTMENDGEMRSRQSSRSLIAFSERRTLRSARFVRGLSGPTPEASVSTNVSPSTLRYAGFHVVRSAPFSRRSTQPSLPLDRTLFVTASGSTDSSAGGAASRRPPLRSATSFILSLAACRSRFIVNMRPFCSAAGGVATATRLCFGSVSTFAEYSRSASAAAASRCSASCTAIGFEDAIPSFRTPKKAVACGEASSKTPAACLKNPWCTKTCSVNRLRKTALASVSKAPRSVTKAAAA
mmetsp:Transcript_23848/g.71156  ORF Transcript_23848/g.71156 Transcript_23848/m.71156 type:complete len:256 (-) Transcript_23848:726-1493(-)